MATEATSGTQEVRSWSELARQFLARVDRLAPRLGDISLAAVGQFLKCDGPGTAPGPRSQEQFSPRVP